MALKQIAFFSTTLDANLGTGSALAISLADYTVIDTNLATNDTIELVIDRNSVSEREIVLVSKSGNGNYVVTQRGLYGTSDQGHDSGMEVTCDDTPGYYNNALENAYPVGSIYMNASVATNPGTLLGFGTWTAFGAGKVPVGIDSGDTDFDTAEETGGAKTHTLTEAEMPPHNHTIDMDTASYSSGTGESANFGQGAPSHNNYDGSIIGNTGDGEAHNNLQPYIVVYMWKRTA